MLANGATYVGGPFSEVCLCIFSDTGSSNLAGGIYTLRGAQEASANAGASQGPGQARKLAESSVLRMKCR